MELKNSSSTVIAAALCKRLEAIRLSKNISQAELAKQAGVSRSTLTRIADGKGISLDSFIRVVQALGLTEHLATLLPDPSIRPVELAARAGKHRQRASTKRTPAQTQTSPITSPKTSPWTWGDEDKDP